MPTKIKKTKKHERKELKMNTLEAMTETLLRIEKTRVALQVRHTHLSLAGHEDKITDEAMERIKAVEDWIKGIVASLIQTHPAYPWFSKIKGVGNINIAKVVGQIDITKAPTISSLWKFCGYAPENGHAAKPTKGQKLPYNSHLKPQCWVLGDCLIKTGGVYYNFYIAQKEKLAVRFASVATKVLPTPAGQWCCSNCGQSWRRKIDIVPCCDSQTIIKKLREEPIGVIWQGHLHYMAMRLMIKRFLACLWLVWREMEGLPIRKPYAIDQLRHDGFVNPWEMIDKE
jgi:hypothetical protein